MKYVCMMCGNEVEASSLPTDSCQACGNDTFREKPFDGKCPLCDQGYYADEELEFCGSCGYRLGAKPPAAPTKSVVIPALAKRMPSLFSSAETVPLPQSGNGTGWLELVRRAFGCGSRK